MVVLLRCRLQPSLSQSGYDSLSLPQAALISAVFAKGAFRYNAFLGSLGKGAVSRRLTEDCSPAGLTEDCLTCGTARGGIHNLKSAARPSLPG